VLIALSPSFVVLEEEALPLMFNDKGAFLRGWCGLPSTFIKGYKMKSETTVSWTDGQESDCDKNMLKKPQPLSSRQSPE
jgi:hypothetical protein